MNQVHNVILHTDEKSEVHRAEIKQLGISLPSQTQCPQSVFTCFPKNAVCDPSGIILVPHNCSQLHLLQMTQPAPHLFRNPKTLPYARFVTENADIIRETLHDLNSDIHYLECQIQSLLSTLYSVLGRQYPGRVLTSLLHRQSAGITVGDVITELACTPINVTLVHSLQYGQYFSSRPLIQYYDFNGTLQTGQLYRDGNAYPGVKFLESFIPGRVFTFLINGTFYTFQNYTLTHVDSDVCLLSPTLAPVNAHYESFNYQSIDQLFPSSSFGFEDVNSLLQSISETNIMKNKLGSLFQQSGESSASAQPSYVLDTTTSALKSVFLQMLSSITNPFVNGVISIIFFLSLFWAIILTVWTLRVIIPHLFAIARNKLSAKNDDDDDCNAIANQSSGR